MNGIGKVKGSSVSGSVDGCGPPVSTWPGRFELAVSPSLGRAHVWLKWAYSVAIHRASSLQIQRLPLAV